MPYYQGECNISGLTLPKVLIVIPCEKNQRETRGSRKPTVTGLTSPADGLTGRGPMASKFKPTGLTSMGDRSDRSNSDRATGSVLERGIYTPHPHPFVGADVITFQSHL